MFAYVCRCGDAYMLSSEEVDEAAELEALVVFWKLTKAGLVVIRYR